MSENELEQARLRINRIDDQILEALDTRMRVAEDVARYKAAHRLPILDAAREQEVMRDRVERSRERGLPEGAEELFRIILRMSRERQDRVMHELSGDSEDAPIRAGYQGVPGANSHLALQNMLGESIDAQSFASFEDVFAAVQNGDVAYGILPVENSYTGSVMQVYDLLGKYDVQIIGECSLPIRHALAAVPGACLEDIAAVYSHEQALRQCAEFFGEYPKIEARPFYNTAGAAQYVAEQNDASVAAICNEHAAKTYGLEVLLSDIEASQHNTTRFLLIAAQPYHGSDATRALLRFTLAHEPGSLAQALTHFASYGLNMTKIESRPAVDRNFEYVFYVDFEGVGVGAMVLRALEGAAPLFADVSILGVYPKGQLPAPGDDAAEERRRPVWSSTR